MSEPPIVSEVFADVVCPFTHVGLRRFVERRDEAGRTDLVLRVRAWPLELVNGKPMDPAFIDEEIEIIRESVAPDLFTGFEQSAFPSTSMPAFALAAAAYRTSDRLGEQVSLELRDLIFEQGVDVSDPEVLAELAAKHGLEISDADRLAGSADHAEGSERGVIGSPHFFTPKGGFFCPALEVGRNEADELYVNPDPVAFANFMEACLSV